MTREHAKQLLPIIKAWSEGAELQLKASGGWHELSGNPTFEYSLENYRIKPPGREFWLVSIDGGFSAFTSKPYAGAIALNNGADTIHVREVIP